jgi:hypothetical protein
MVSPIVNFSRRSKYQFAFLARQRHKPRIAERITGLIGQALQGRGGVAVQPRFAGGARMR